MTEPHNTNTDFNCLMVLILYSDGPTTDSDDEYLQGPYVSTLVRLSSMIESGSGKGTLMLRPLKN